MRVDVGQQIVQEYFDDNHAGLLFKLHISFHFQETMENLRFRSTGKKKLKSPHFYLIKLSDWSFKIIEYPVRVFQIDKLFFLNDETFVIVDIAFHNVTKNDLFHFHYHKN